MKAVWLRWKPTDFPTHAINTIRPHTQHATASYLFDIQCSRAWVLCYALNMRWKALVKCRKWLICFTVILFLQKLSYWSSFHFASNEKCVRREIEVILSCIAFRLFHFISYIFQIWQIIDVVWKQSLFL